MADDPELRRLLWYLLGGKRGGEMRARVIRSLHERPSNLNQLATSLGVEYRLVQHHIGVLKRNSLVTTTGEHYGLTYFLQPWFEAHYEEFEKVVTQLKFNLTKGQRKEPPNQ